MLYIVRVSIKLLFIVCSWEQAETYFKSALEKVQAVDRDVMVEKWEPLLNNLGHTARKLK